MTSANNCQVCIIVREMRLDRAVRTVYSDALPALQGRLVSFPAQLAQAYVKFEFE